MSNKNLLKFRKNYRGNINSRYSGIIHVTFVFVVGLAFILLCLSNIPDRLTVIHVFMFVLALCVFNVGEYYVHKNFGHKKLLFLGGIGRLFYRRHTGDHHSFFDYSNMTYDTKRDWRVIFFPAWLVLVIISIALVAGYIVKVLLSVNSSQMFMSGIVSGYLLYEFLHYCYHLPATHFLARLPWVKQMKNLHAIHHHFDYMQTKNFNLTFPMMDYIMGTYLWIPEDEQNK